MSEAGPAIVQQQLTQCVELLTKTLGTNLMSVHLFGSSLVGGLQKYSDLDLFVVTDHAITAKEKREIVDHLLQISGIYMKGPKYPVEMTIVEKGALNPWRYPPLFTFQYGEWLREPFEKGETDLWSDYEMPDLALIVTQIFLKSETLWGSGPEALLSPVPYRDFISAMIHDLNRLSHDLESDTRNVLLTYARIWSTLATDQIRSKPAAADWAMRHLPEEYGLVMERARSICVGTEAEHWGDLKAHIRPCAHFMEHEIQAQASLINLDDTEKSIQLNENQARS